MLELKFVWALVGIVLFVYAACTIAMLMITCHRASCVQDVHWRPLSNSQMFPTLLFQDAEA